ncbi:MAG: ATP-binding protein, partial [bacterium]
MNQKIIELLEIKGLNVREVKPDKWDKIIGMDFQKNLIERKILLPLQYPDLAAKHGVVHPKAILLFGPPGTGKTIFAEGIAARMNWFFIEVTPSTLIHERIETQAKSLKELFEKLSLLNQAIIFFDEFEEIAQRPENATKVERMISNELLKQLVRFRENKDILIICATNHIRQLIPALLRPGRFDFILPIGPADEITRKAMWKSFLNNLNKNDIDLEKLAQKSEGFTAADIEAVCMQAAQVAFEKELASNKEYKITTQDIITLIKHHKATLDTEDMTKFKEDINKYARCGDYCNDCFSSLRKKFNLADN